MQVGSDVAIVIVADEAVAQRGLERRSHQQEQENTEKDRLFRAEQTAEKPAAWRGIPLGVGFRPVSKLTPVT